MPRFLVSILLAIVIFFAFEAGAQQVENNVPRLTRYSGVVSDAAGSPSLEVAPNRAE